MTRLEQIIGRPVPFLHRSIPFVTRRGESLASVQPGEVYRRQVNRTWVEIARVLRTAVDEQGIEHVTFDLTIERSKVAAGAIAEQRMLNLRSFRELFTEPVQA